jgi:NAD(P)-dependent dehydrogenase (short-subunit alcohol dehydrogenase family)
LVDAKKKLVSVARQIKAFGGEAIIEPDAPRKVLSRCGRIDVLINNAAGLVGKPFEQFALAEFDEQVATNVRSIFFLYRIAGGGPESS